MICNPWDIVIVPFPFSDRPQTKRRPALVLTDAHFNAAGHTTLAMITTKDHRPWPGDQPIANPKACGLPVPCLVRLKLFTIDNRLLERKLGALAAAERKSLKGRIAEFFAP